MRMFAAVLVLITAAPELSAGTTHYTIQIQGKPSGALTTQVADDGSVSVEFSYPDSGRGSELKEQFKLAKYSTFLSYSATGKSEFGAPIADSFARSGDHAEWQSLADRGNANIRRSAESIPT